MKKIFFRWLKLFLLVYGLLGIALYYLQNKIYFHPQPLDAGYQYPFKQPFEEMKIPYSQDAEISMVRFPAPDSQAHKAVLFFHGNMKNIGWYAHYAGFFTSQGYDLWMIDYPGFGKSRGTFSEPMLYDWALQLYKLARARYPADSLVIYGMSMGTGIAAQLASVRDCRALILESPYYDFPSLLGDYVPIYPLQSMIHFKLPAWKYLQKVTAPVTIIHGTDDWTIPERNSRRLIPYLKKDDRYILIPGGKHNNLTSFPRYRQVLDSVLHSAAR